MYGGTGMGASGMGARSGPMMPSSPGAGINPQLLAMLAQMQGPQGMSPMGAFQAPPGPIQAPPTGTPMAGYIGAGAPAMGHPMGGGMPVGQPPGMNGGTLPGATPMAAGNPQLMQMLQSMKGQQGGLPANGGPMTGAPAMAQPNMPGGPQGPTMSGPPMGAPGAGAQPPMQGPAASGAPVPPQGAMNPGLMAYLQHLMGGGAGMPAAPVSQ